MLNKMNTKRLKVFGKPFNATYGNINILEKVLKNIVTENNFFQHL